MRCFSFSPLFNSESWRVFSLLVLDKSTQFILCSLCLHSILLPTDGEHAYELDITKGMAKGFLYFS